MMEGFEFKIFVRVAGEDCDTHGWHTNGQWYASEENAHLAAAYLFSRWTAVREYKVIQVAKGTPAYAVYVPGKGIVVPAEVA